MWVRFLSLCEGMKRDVSSVRSSRKSDNNKIMSGISLMFISTRMRAGRTCTLLLWREIALLRVTRCKVIPVLAQQIAAAELKTWEVFLPLVWLWPEEEADQASVLSCVLLSWICQCNVAFQHKCFYYSSNLFQWTLRIRPVMNYRLFPWLISQLCRL